MERHEFLKSLGIGLAAVCTGCAIASCGSNPKNEDPLPESDGSIFSVDLGAELLNIGDAKVTSGIILARTAAGNSADSFSAVQVACTHEGSAIAYNNTAGLYICPLHGSRFSTTGQVIMGPALVNLRKYNVAVTGSDLTVSA